MFGQDKALYIDEFRNLVKAFIAYEEEKDTDHDGHVCGVSCTSDSKKVTALAAQFQVSNDTVIRWCQGTAKPGNHIVTRVIGHIKAMNMFPSRNTKNALKELPTDDGDSS